MSLGPIPWSSIALWAQLNDLDLDDLCELNLIVRAMEQAEREYDEKKDKK